MNSPNQIEQSGEDHSSAYANHLLIHQKDNLVTDGMVAFSGCSMKPTLIDGDLVEVHPYDQRTVVQVGDIIYYQLSGVSKAIIHRVIRVTPAGVIARGDNNSFDDIEPIPSKFILGQVTAAWRGSRRRKIVGGRRGMAYYKSHHILLAFVGVIIPILRPFCQILVRWNIIAHCLPQRFRPKVVKFNGGKENYLRLVWLKRVIGEFDFNLRRWKIYHPFRLLFSEKIISFYELQQREGSSTFTHHAK